MKRITLKMQPTVYAWQKAPFLRLLVSLIAGIVLQWQLQFSVAALLVAFVLFFAVLFIYNLLPVTKKFRLQWITGFLINLVLATLGALLIWSNNITNNKQWFGNVYADKNLVVATIEEPLVEKQNSVKAIANINAVYKNGKQQLTTGSIIIYFKKDSNLKVLKYGSVISFVKPLQAIKNGGNPGGFDYKRYLLFQGITHQVYLTQKDFRRTETFNKKGSKTFIYDCRSWVIATIKKYISGQKEQGLAEALLIGYKDDLDKNLVEAYTNTGVVHVIAISGLHVGLIYWLLMGLTRPLKKKQTAFVRLFIVLSCLWLFAFLAGAQPSVLRSAVMFSFIATAKLIARRSSVYNTLALSAFALLCYNPYWLWDVGFQLSYTAVLSIFLFFRPVYNWFYFPNKTLDFLWKLNAVTIAAQILTVPLSIYHFHQFPVLFLFTNLVAVPLSSIILIGEILLCLLALIPTAAAIVGKILHQLIYWMNTYVERLNEISFAVWNGLSINLVQLFLLIIFMLAFCFWLMEKQKLLLCIAAGSLLAFISLRSVFIWQATQQQKLVVYNVPGRRAIDLLNGTQTYFIGDTVLLNDDFSRNFHLQPARILHRTANIETSIKTNNFLVGGKEILLIKATTKFVPSNNRHSIDLLVLSKNPKLYITKLHQQFLLKQVVADGSVPAWKAKLWKKDCDSLHIPFYNVAEQGAFVMKL
ncbi:MAG: ComEC/Rec2 family competence protein [Bacteroidota bacterium]